MSLPTYLVSLKISDSVFEIYPENPNYLIYRDGRVYSKYSYKFLSSHFASGYRRVNVTVNGVNKIMSVHRLVAICFVKNADIDRNICVNHKNSNKLDNNYLNLEWVTASENSIHSSKKEGFEPTHIRSVEQISMRGDSINVFSSIASASRYTGISYAAIIGCCRGKSSKTLDRSTGIWCRWNYFQETKEDLYPLNAKTIPDFDNYLVTTHGRVYSLLRKRYLGTNLTQDGYLAVTIGNSYVRKTFSVHRLVAITHLPNIYENKVVTHIDSNRQNNDISNLEWVTHQENSKHWLQKKT